MPSIVIFPQALASQSEAPGDLFPEGTGGASPEADDGQFPTIRVKSN
jgi:hypothetical protein